MRAVMSLGFRLDRQIKKSYLMMVMGSPGPNPCKTQPQSLCNPHTHPAQPAKSLHNPKVHTRHINTSPTPVVLPEAQVSYVQSLKPLAL